MWFPIRCCVLILGEGFLWQNDLVMNCRRPSPGRRVNEVEKEERIYRRGVVAQVADGAGDISEASLPLTGLCCRALDFIHMRK